MKKVCLGLLFVMLFSTTVFAVELPSSTTVTGTLIQQDDVNEPTSLLEQFLENLNHPKSKFFIEKEGIDMTEKYLGQVSRLIQEGNYDILSEFVSNNGLDLVIEYTEPIREDGEQLLSIYATTNHSKIIYHNPRAKNNSARKGEWTTKLNGSITYNTRTGEITNASTPSISFTKSDYLFPYKATNISTGRVINRGNVKFYGSYTMKQYGSGETQGITYDYGSFTDSFLAYPH